MIDKLVIQIPFSAHVVEGSYSQGSGSFLEPFLREGVFRVDAAKLPFRLGARELYRDETGRLCADDIFHPWESLATSHGGLAIKTFNQGNGKLHWPYLELKCSPAKLVQPHNVFGTDFFKPCVFNMLHVLTSHYPDLQFSDGRQFLDIGNARVSEFDLTYSVSIPLESKRLALMDVLRSTSKGQTKNRGDSYETTVYFGSKNSRLKKIKVYLKGPEIKADIKKRQAKKMELPDSDIVTLAQSLVRFELTIKKDWLERRLIPTKLFDFVNFFDNDQAQLRAVYNLGCKDLFDSMKGEIVTMTDDKKVYAALEKVHGGVRGRVARLMGFYQALKGVGFDALKAQHSKTAFYRYIKDLELCGFNRAHLCSLHVTKGNTVVAFPTLISLDGLGEPAPDDYVYPLLADVG